MKKIVFFAIFLEVFILSDQNSTSFADIPEPLVFDLVRHLDAKKGEAEFNTLFIQEQSSRFSQLQYSPEFEYAPIDRLAFEVELPMRPGLRVDGWKAAVQWTIGCVDKELFQHGIQGMVKREFETSSYQYTPMYIVASRFAKRWSTVLMFGAQLTDGAHEKLSSRFMNNLSMFYDYNDQVELAVESNLEGLGSTFESLRITPQIHFELEDKLKLQFGFGGLYESKEWHAASAFRINREF